MRSAALLLRQEFGPLLAARTLAAVLLSVGALVWTFGSGAQLPIALTTGLALLALTIEAAGRYLFFRCVVPRNMPLNFFATKPVH